MGGRHVADALRGSPGPAAGEAREKGRYRNAVADALYWAPRRVWHRMWHPGPVRRARMRAQRARRGWSEGDTAGLGDYLMEVITGSLDYFRAHLHSYPAGMTEEEWSGTLETISTSIGQFLAVTREGPLDDESTEEYAGRYRQAEQNAQAALVSLASVLADLWD